MTNWKSKKISAPIVIALYLAVGVAICYLGLTLINCMNPGGRRYDDVDLYKNRVFLDEEKFDSRFNYTAKLADKFLPSYEEIDFGYSDIGFYIYDGSPNITKTALTFVLELKFDNDTAYSAAREEILGSYTLMTEEDVQSKSSLREVKYELEVGSFECVTVNGDGYTKFPEYYGLLCFNDSGKTIRYLYFRELEAPESFHGDSEYVIECTNCDW